MSNSQVKQRRRVELILQQLDALPTLSPIAVRLLDLTAAKDTEAKDVIQLIGSDPALASKVLKLCRCHPRGRALSVTSLDRAVVLLGFDAVRNAVLSIQVIELFDGVPSPGDEIRGERALFDRLAFWQHSLAVAVACDLIVASTSLRGRMKRSEAYLSGLLHDLGQLVLHVIMPASFDRVCELAEAHNLSIDQACRRIFGLDSHTAGKRLAEHWHLPHALADVLWLHGQPFNSLPELPHREMIGLVTLADAVVRRQHLSTIGHVPRGEDLGGMCRDLGLDESVIDAIIPCLHEEVHARAISLGLDLETSTGMLLRSVSRANEVLGRLNATMRRRTADFESQTRTLKAITEFHAAAMPSGSLATVLGKVVQSAAPVLGGGLFAMLYQARVGESWQLLQFAIDGRLLRCDMIEPPLGSTAVEGLGDDVQLSMEALTLLPWLTEYLGAADNLAKVRLLPLRCGWGTSAFLLYECEAPAGGPMARLQLDALCRTWAAAIAAAGQHHGARRLSEQLAEANRSLADTQDELAGSRALAAVGEVAAGAAHEMNNPLAVISGRAQILAQKVDRKLKPMAQQIVKQSHYLSNMITALRAVAQPAVPKCRPTDLAELLERVVREVSPKNSSEGQVKLIVKENMPPVNIDPDQIARAVHELIRNALEAKPSAQIELSVQIDGPDDRLKIQVVDDGPGMSDRTLAHAFAPFFSDKPAGRQPGLGLAMVRRFVEAHGGRLTLENGPAGGAVATIWLSTPTGRKMRDVA